jgi:hypothetical protein
MNVLSENCTALIPVWETGIVKNVLSITCRIISPFVKKIVVLHCGPKSEYEKCFNYLKDINNITIEHYDYKGNAETVLNYLIKFVNQNEWALILDSDQRPTNEFLLNLKATIDYMDNHDYELGACSTIHHEYKTELYIVGYPVPKNMSDASYYIYSLCKITKDFKIITNRGMHYSFINKNNNPYYIPYGINHFKLYFEYYSSIFLSGYTDPTVHSRGEQLKIEEKNRSYYVDFEKLKLKYNMITSNDFKEKAYKHEIPDEFFVFFSNPNFCKENNNETTCFLDHAYKFCTIYKFSMDESFKHDRACSNECCRYN